MDITSWYNNKEDSDIIVRLKSGENIYAHRIVLKSKSEVFRGIFMAKMREAKDGIVTFPEYSDAAIVFVLRSMYGWPGSIESLNVFEWFELFQFANYIGFETIISQLEKNIHVQASVVDLATLGYKLSNERIINHALREVCNVLTLMPDEQYYGSLCEMSYDVYCYFRSKWQEYGLDEYILFSIDCWYSSHNSDDDKMLVEFMNTVALTKFSSANYESAKKLPIVSASPIIVRLFDTLYKNKISSTVPDNRSLRHGEGKISATDVRLDLVAPMTNGRIEGNRRIFQSTRNGGLTTSQRQTEALVADLLNDLN